MTKFNLRAVIAAHLFSAGAVSAYVPAMAERTKRSPEPKEVKSPIITPPSHHRGAREAERRLRQMARRELELDELQTRLPE